MHPTLPQIEPKVHTRWPAAPEASAFCKANTGHPKVCIWFMLLPARIELKSSSLDVPSSSTGKLLWTGALLCRAYGKKAMCTASGQWVQEPQRGHVWLAWWCCFGSAYLHHKRQASGACHDMLVRRCCHGIACYCSGNVGFSCCAWWRVVQSHIWQQMSP